MRRKNRKGFTIVELVIVIAVIGILAAILIPTFINVTAQAQRTSNESFVRNINTQLAVKEAQGRRSATMHDAVETAKDMGFDVTKITPYEGNDIIYDQEADRFAIVKADYAANRTAANVVFADASFDNARPMHKLWKVYDAFPSSQSYSIYAKDKWATTDIDDLEVGFDIGQNTNVVSIDFVGNGETQKDVLIRTNGGTLTVNAGKASVKHYEFATAVDVEDVDSATYHEHGTVGRIKYSDNSGRIQFEKGSITYCYMNKSSDTAADVSATTKNADAIIHTDVKSDGTSAVYENKTVVVDSNKEVEVATCRNHNIEYDVITIGEKQYMICRCCGAYSVFEENHETHKLEITDASPELIESVDPETGVVQIKDDVVQAGPNLAYGFANSYYVDAVSGENPVPAHWVHEIETAAQFENLHNHLARADQLAAMTDRSEDEEKEFDDLLKSEYKLTKEIDLTNITNSALVDTTFYGTLNGNGKAIKNYTYTDPQKTGAGLIGNYYDGVIVKNLTLDNVKVTGNESCGLLFGKTYCHGSGSRVADTVLTVEKVTVNANCLLSGVKGLGVIAGSTRYFETIKATDCVNKADIIANGYNVGGLFGTMSGNLTITLTGCENHGSIRATTNVGGLIGHSPDVKNLTVNGCSNYGRVVAFSKNKNATTAGWFAAMTAANPNLTYEDNYNEGKILYISSCAEDWARGGAFESSLTSGISTKEDAALSTFITVDDTIVLNVTYDEHNNWVVPAVANAAYYTVAMQVWARDVKLSGSTVSVYKEHYLPYMKRFNTVEELASGFGRITRAGYVLNPVYTSYQIEPDCGLSQNAVLNGAANFFRLPYASRNNYTLNQVVFDSTLNEWVFVIDSQNGCPEGEGVIFSPKDTWVSYVIAAFDQNDHVIAAYTQEDRPTGDYTTFLKNMGGDLVDAPQFWTQPWPNVA